MAFMSQETKTKLSAEIAKVMPSNWKYTLRVEHHSTLVLTIRQADVDLIGKNLVVQSRMSAEGRPQHRNLNQYHLGSEYEGGLLKTFQAIKTAMNVGNHDRSDVQADYFDVGWYTDINIGEFSSPFRYVTTPHKVSMTRPTKTNDPVGRFRRQAMTIQEWVAAQTTPRPEGMPDGLSEAEELVWLKNRVRELEAAQ